MGLGRRFGGDRDVGRRLSGARDVGAA